MFVLTIRFAANQEGAEWCDSRSHRNLSAKAMSPSWEVLRARLWSPGIMVDMLAANGDRATAFILLASIVVPLAVVALMCWFFWTHRHDD
jgi:hypothetical protein